MEKLATVGKSASTEQLHCSKCHQLVRNPHLSQGSILKNSTNSVIIHHSDREDHQEQQEKVQRKIKYSQLQSISPKAAATKDEIDNIILSKFVCRESDEMEHALHRMQVMYGIANKGVDRLTDVVISQ